MKPKTLLPLLFCLSLSLIATIAPAADFRFAGEPSQPSHSAAEIEDLKARVAAIEKRIEALADETRTERAELRVAMEGLYESNRLMREAAKRQEQQMVQQPVKADPIPTIANTYLPADQPTVQAWPASVQWPTTQASYASYQNAAGQLPRTMVGNQVVEASPAYEYTDSQGRHWRDYPVSIGNQPVSNSYPSTVSSCGPGYTCVNGQCYRNGAMPRTYSMGGFSSFGSVCGPGGCR